MIDFQIPAEILGRHSAVAAVAAGLMRSRARYYDEHEHERPVEFINQMWPAVRDEARQKLGMAGSGKSMDGGAALLQRILLIEALSWGDAGQYLCLPGGRLGGTAVEAVGTEEQRARFLRRFAESETPVWASMAITEPDAGSDNSAMRTTAVLDEQTNEWVLNGQKIFITSGSLSLVESEGFCVVWATVDATAGRRGIKSFVVEAGTPGVTVSPGMDKLGIRASDTVIVTFEDARIPHDNVLGSPQVQSSGSTKGFQGAMRTFDASRPGVAASGVGVARAALEYVNEKLRESGMEIDVTRPRHLMTAVERDILEMEGLYKSAWLLTLRAVAAIVHGRGNRLEASMCKAHAGTAATRITQKAVELLGPLGYSRELLVEKFMRDAKINDIYEGTRQINLLIVARSILGYSRRELK